MTWVFSHISLWRAKDSMGNRGSMCRIVLDQSTWRGLFTMREVLRIENRMPQPCCSACWWTDVQVGPKYEENTGHLVFYKPLSGTPQLRGFRARWSTLILSQSELCTVREILKQRHPRTFFWTSSSTFIDLYCFFFFFFCYFVLYFI